MTKRFRFKKLIKGIVESYFKVIFLLEVLTMFIKE